MGTYFEAVLVAGPGQDGEHLSAVADALWAEVDRVERLLSRFDPRSEISRINRLAAREPVTVDYEILGVLLTCLFCWHDTNGCFDVSVGTAGRDADGRPRPPLAIDRDARAVTLPEPGTSLDLGGFGKGYALDRLAEILSRHWVRSALVHAGTSSVVAVGAAPGGSPWTVGVRDSFTGGSERAFAHLPLADCALSCSAVRHAGQATSDIMGRAGQPLAGDAACVVLADTAVSAEVLSTAALVMGPRGTVEYLRSWDDPDGSRRVAWIDRADGEPRLDWLDVPHHWRATGLRPEDR